MNYVWVRSRCGGADTSVWTYSNSFHTLCAPATVPTAIEQFVIPTSTLEWLPSCWALASGDLTSNSQLIYDEDLLAPFQPWINSEWRNVTGSGNYAAKTYFVGQIVDSVSEWLISPPYDLGTSGNKSLEFDLALTKNGNSQQGALDNDDKFAVIISTDEGNTWSSTNVVQQWTSPQSISAAGQHVSIPLNTYSGIVRIAFYAQSKVFVSPVSNLFVDNVQITGVMPVVLLDFTGKLLPPSPGGEGRGEAFLQWRTATEQNNKGFELQRSISGTDFSTIAFVPTKAREGNSTIVLSYNYTDNKPFAGNNYYRLKQIDKDGKATLSNVVLIKGNAAEQLVLSALYPNPTKQTLNIVLTSPTLQNAQLLITDIAGKLIHKQSVQLQQGDNNKTVNVAALQKDNYILKVVCDNGCEAAVSKFVKE